MSSQSPAILLLLCIGGFAQPCLMPVQAQVTETVSQAAPDSTRKEQADDGSAVRHPELRRPPLPEPEGRGGLPPVEAATPQAMAWRTTAMALSTGKPVAKPHSIKVFDVEYGDALLAVISSCLRAGLKVEALNSDAGEILASGSSMRIVISITENAPGKTRVAAACHSGAGAETAMRVIESLMQICQEALRKQERI